MGVTSLTDFEAQLRRSLLRTGGLDIVPPEIEAFRQRPGRAQTLSATLKAIEVNYGRTRVEALTLMSSAVASMGLDLSDDLRDRLWELGDGDLCAAWVRATLVRKAS